MINKQNHQSSKENKYSILTNPTKLSITKSALKTDGKYLLKINKVLKYLRFPIGKINKYLGLKTHIKRPSITDNI